mmetsp:Transcript_83859/g.233996  ORF Transcript_83859/g.233996 Transcript_83859/m.233996 type:complete len:259 (+) Transcript_83859:499-1275(+)
MATTDHHAQHKQRKDDPVGDVLPVALQAGRPEENKNVHRTLEQALHQPDAHGQGVHCERHIIQRRREAAGSGACVLGPAMDLVGAEHEKGHRGTERRGIPTQFDAPLRDHAGDDRDDGVTLGLHCEHLRQLHVRETPVVLGNHPRLKGGEEERGGDPRDSTRDKERDEAMHRVHDAVDDVQKAEEEAHLPTTDDVAQQPRHEAEDCRGSVARDEKKDDIISFEAPCLVQSVDVRPLKPIGGRAAQKGAQIAVPELRIR